MSGSDKKVKVAMLSVASNTILIILKVVAGILSGSVSIISEAIHSGMDLIASIIAFFSVKVSSKPADESHPYGHGKIENVSGVIEGLLIFVAAILIIKEAINKIINPHDISETFIAVCVMGFSAAANFFVSRMLYKVAKKEDSIALEADALHLKTDVYTSIGVAAGLLLMKITGLYILDPLAAMAVAFLIIKEAWELTNNAFKPLVDTSLSLDEQQKIKTVLEGFSDRITGYHDLKTRKGGHMRYVEFHISLPGDTTLKDTHNLIDIIEKDIGNELKNTDIIIHAEPDWS